MLQDQDPNQAQAEARDQEAASSRVTPTPQPKSTLLRLEDLIGRSPDEESGSLECHHEFQAHDAEDEESGSLELMVTVVDEVTG